MTKIVSICILFYSSIAIGQICHSSITYVEGKNDTIHVPIVVREIVLDEFNFLSLVAEDTVKPSKEYVIFSSDKLIGDSVVIIHNPVGHYIQLFQGNKLPLINAVKKHKHLWCVELPWDKFEKFVMLDSIKILAGQQIFNLYYSETEIISDFHRYLVERIAEEQPTIWKGEEFIPYDSDPKVIKKVDAIYPERAIREGIQGDVYVKVWSDKNGRVRRVDILKATSDLFIASAIEAAKQWTFTPVKIQGKPATVWISIPFRFRLSEIK